MLTDVKAFTLALALGACGGNKDEAPAPATAPPTAGSADTPAAEPAAKPAAPDSKPAAPDTSHGSCRVLGSGGMTFDQTSGNTARTLTVNQWYTPAQRAQLGADETGFIINCLGPDIRLNLLSSKGEGVYGPKLYQVGGKGSQVKVMGQIGEAKDRQDVIISTATGTLAITAFDDKHIAGSLEVTVKTLPDKGGIKLLATFDLDCHNHAACK